MPTKQRPYRGMNMRDMKAREMRNREAFASGRQDVRAREMRELERPPESLKDDDDLELGEGEALAVDDDGTCRVRRGGSRRDEGEASELPSEPPPGWLDG